MRRWQGLLEEWILYEGSMAALSLKKKVQAFISGRREETIIKTSNQYIIVSVEEKRIYKQ